MPACNNKSKEKLARYKSHRSFLTICHEEKVIPQGLSIYIEPSIGNQDIEFIETWHERLQGFSLTLMLEVINLCDRTIENISEGIAKTKRELNQQLNDNEREEIIAASQRNDEVNKKHLEQRKRKKFNYLKYKPKTENPFETRKSSDQPERPTIEHQKPLYSSVLKRKSNTNLQRKFSKQNLAYNNKNKIKQTVLNARHN